MRNYLQTLLRTSVQTVSRNSLKIQLINRLTIVISRLRMLIDRLDRRAMLMNRLTMGLIGKLRKIVVMSLIDWLRD